MEQKKNKNTAFTRQEIEQHLQSALASATPDLWSRLNAAVLEETLSEEKTKKNPRIIRRTFTGWAAAAAACICLMCGGGYYHYEYLQIISEVEIDVNPSLKLSVNRKDQVIKAQALNEDGVQLVDSAQLKGRKLEEAVGHVVDSLVEQGYFQEDQKEHAILVSVSGRSEEKAEKLKTAVTADVEQALTRQEVKAVVYDQVIQVTDELQELADTYQVSLGKAEFIGQLVSENDSLSQDQEEAYSWLMKQTMESLTQEIHQNEYQISSSVTVIKTEPAAEGKSRREPPSRETDGKSRDVKAQEPDQKEQEAEKAGDQTAGDGEKAGSEPDVQTDNKAEEKPGNPDQLKDRDKKNTEQTDREEGQTEEKQEKKEAEGEAESPEKETAQEKEAGGQDSLNQEEQKPDSRNEEVIKEEIAGEEPAKAGQKEGKEGSESEAKRREEDPETFAESREEEVETFAESREEEVETSAKSQEREAEVSAESQEGEAEASVESREEEAEASDKSQEGEAEASAESREEEVETSAESQEGETGTSAESRNENLEISSKAQEGEFEHSAEDREGEAETSAGDQETESESLQENRDIQPEESETSSVNQDGQAGDFQDEEKMPKMSDPEEQDEKAGGQTEEEDVPDTASRIIRMPSDEIDTFEPGDMASQPEKDSVTVTSSGTQIIFEAVEEVVWEEPVYASQLLTGSQRRLLHKGPGAFFNPVPEEEQEGFLYLGPGFMSLYGESVIDINQIGLFKEVRIRPLKGQVYRVTTEKQRQKDE